MTRPQPHRHEGGPGLPDPRPFKRIQAITAVLLVGAALITLLSDQRPSEVRWGAAIGVVLLIAGIALVTWRRRRRE
jgi:LPXTG-motif cell wall-anchored protein